LPSSAKRVASLRSVPFADAHPSAYPCRYGSGKPDRLIPGFGRSGLEFTLTVHVSEFSEQFRVQHELRKRILKRFREEKIEMPVPPRAKA